MANDDTISVLTLEGKESLFRDAADWACWLEVEISRGNRMREEYLRG
jgi:hypothetical protein